AQFLPTGGHFRDTIRDPVYQDALIDLECDHTVELEPALAEEAFECPRLRHRAGKAVENEAAFSVRLLDTIGDDRDHDLVGDELTARHDVLGLQTDGG